MDVTSKTIHKEVITNSWPSALSGISWLPSNDSFIYTHIPNIDSNSPKYIKNTVSVVFELTKTSKNKPVLLSKKNNPLLNINSSDFPIVYSIENYNNYLFGRIGGARSFDDYFYTSNFTSASERVHWKPLYSKKDMVSDFKILDNHFIFLSAKNASNFKLCRTPLSNPNFSSPEVIVKEENNAVITDFVVNSQGVYFVRTKNGVDAKVFEYNNEKITELKLPEAAGEIYVYSKGEKFNDLWIKTWGWIKKGQRYKYKAETKEFISESLNLIKENEQHDNIVVEEIEIKSRDGEMVPLSIMYKKNIKRDGNNSLLIQGYGAFGYSITPYPERIMLNWVQNGGVFAVAHVRGGGEKGEFWHKSGFKNNKFNTWRDLIDCTQFLISNNYTNSKKVAVISSSAGGIMIGKAITERPELFTAAIIKVGLLNPIRLSKMPNGANQSKEFGNIKDSIEFLGLLKMDPYFSLKKGIKYPSVLTTGSMKDARLPAWQGAKFFAKLREVSTSKYQKPILMKIDFKGGHGLTASMTKRNEELVDVLSFAFWQTGHPDFQLKD